MSVDASGSYPKTLDYCTELDAVYSPMDVLNVLTRILVKIELVKFQECTNGFIRIAPNISSHFKCFFELLLNGVTYQMFDQ